MRKGGERDRSRNERGAGREVSKRKEKREEKVGREQWIKKEVRERESGSRWKKVGLCSFYSEETSFAECTALGMWFFTCRGHFE